MSYLSQTDPEIYRAIQNELRRQKEGLEMIPSENYVSEAVLEAMGSILTNKYSEGYPGKRYYGGQIYTDAVENLAIERAKKLFAVDHANVQPYSGSPANQAVYYAVCEPGDTVMGLDLLHGGHLTHGWKINFSARFYRSVPYTVRRDGYLDYDEIRQLARRERPKLIFSGATAYPREFDFETLGKIAREVEAYFVADIAHIIGLIIAGVHQTPVGHADIITSTTHKTLRGPRAGLILCNGNPSEPLKPVKEKTRENLPSLIDRAVFPALQGGPHEHTIAGIAVALQEAATEEFKEYGRQVVKNAKKLAEKLLEHGFNLISGGTDNHLILIDVTNKGINGQEAEDILEKVGISVNKNTVPYDPRKPFSPSGIRIGTPCITTRGLKEQEVQIIGQVITEALENPTNEGVLKKNRQIILEICQNFPLYPDRKIEKS